MAEKLKTAVLGATGYSGLELTRLLTRHPQVEKPLLLRRGTGSDEANHGSAGLPVVSSNGNGHLRVAPFSWPALQQHGTELLFLATPHVVSRELAPEALARGLRVVDLSGAWRLKDAEHREVYGFNDADAVILVGDRAFLCHGIGGFSRGAAREEGCTQRQGKNERTGELRATHGRHSWEVFDG